jgi:hypothetical protein
MVLCTRVTLSEEILLYLVYLHFVEILCVTFVCLLKQGLIR